MGCTNHAEKEAVVAKKKGLRKSKNSICATNCKDGKDCESPTPKASDKRLGGGVHDAVL
jgi:hypothetical protein